MTYLTGGERRPVFLRAPFLLGFLLVVAIFAVIATTGGAAANVEVHNSTLAVDVDTDTAYADLNNTNATATANGTVYFYGIENATGAAVETELSNSTFSIPASGTQLVESAAVNGTKYDEVRVVVLADNTSIAAPTTELVVEVGTFQQVAGGGAAAGGSGTLLGLTLVEWIVLLIALGAVVFFVEG